MEDFSEREEVFKPKAEKLIDAIKASRRMVVFTGAGVSTLSGIPDFRGTHGVYNSPWKGMNVEEILSSDFFFEHPDIFYKWAEEVWYRLEDYEPNIIHKTLAFLEDFGYIPGGIFTQNIDFLHERAGSRKVYCVHGSARVSHCVKCHESFGYETVAPIVRRGEVPHCDKCGGLIKPDIVLYGESLDGDILSKAEKAFSKADLALVLGSSLTVFPAAAFPRITTHFGGKTVIVNAERTGQDDDAYLIFRDLFQVFDYISRRLGSELPERARE